MDAFVVDAVRTPRGRGSKKGSLAGTKPVELLAPLYRTMHERYPSVPVEDIVLGCVHQTGEQGANIAKVSALYADFSFAASGATVTRFCASGLEAMVIAACKVSCGAGPMLTGGVESLSRVPMFSDGGAWFSDPDVVEKTRFVHMGVSADLVATLEGFSREELDAYAVRSHTRARAAVSGGLFGKSIVPVCAADGSIVLDRDECPRDVTLAALSALEPAFVEAGAAGGDALCLSHHPEAREVKHLHHVGVSPALADAASLLLVVSGKTVKELGLTPRAKIKAFADASVEPTLMLTGNVEASRRALARAGMQPKDVDLFEVNESFAAIPLHYARHMGIDPERMNVHGGAIALGHPLGATGGILIATAIDELERRDRATAVVSICGGAGVAVSIVLER